MPPHPEDEAACSSKPGVRLCVGLECQHRSSVRTFVRFLRFRMIGPGGSGWQGEMDRARGPPSRFPVMPGEWSPAGGRTLRVSHMISAAVHYQRFHHQRPGCGAWQTAGEVGALWLATTYACGDSWRGPISNRPSRSCGRASTPSRRSPFPCEQALGRTLARDVVSAEDVPSFDKSAMDGYALRGAETFGASPTDPVSFRVIGEVFPGDVGRPVRRARVRPCAS